jgi:bacterioferritin-associated ferredoxin
VSPETLLRTLLTIIRICVYYWRMIVCVCKAVSDRQIRAAVRDGATRLQDLSRQTGLGTCCGKCLPEARSTLAESLKAQHEHGPREACVYFANPAPAAA